MGLRVQYSEMSNPEQTVLHSLSDSITGGASNVRVKDHCGDRLSELANNETLFYVGGVNIILSYL